MANARFKIAAGLLVLTALVGAGCGDDDAASPSDTAAPGGTVSAGTSTTTTLTPKDGGNLTHGVFSETAGLDPAVTFGGGATGTTEVGAIFDTIMRYDTVKKEFVPQIADSLTPNADFSEWTLKLKPNIKFTDGTDYDADAVVFGMKRHVQYGSRAAALVAGVKEYTVVDKVTLKFTLTAPYSNFPYVLAFTPGMIPSPTAVKAACKIGQPDEIKLMTQCPFNLNPVGAGPYMIDKFLPKESITLKRNATYWGGKPHLDTIKFVTVGSSQAVLEGLRSGTLQMGYMREPEPGKIASEDATLGTYLNLVWAGNGLVLNNGKVNCRNGLPASVCAGKPDGIVELDTPTKDLRVRQAISFAIDPKVIDTRAQNNTGFPGGSFFQTGSKWKSSAPVNTYDLEQAKKLVTTVKAEGKWDGTVRLNCSMSQANMSIAVQTMLQAAGFTVNLNNGQETAAQINIITNQKQFDIGCWGFSMADEAPEVIFSLAFNAGAAGNSMNHQITDIDAQSKLMREAKTDADKQAALDKIQDIWRAQVPSVITGATPERIVWRKSVHGVTPNVASTILWHDVWVE
jgi:peptide/nickel transport system substrate-binding protein